MTHVQDYYFYRREEDVTFQSLSCFTYCYLWGLSYQYNRIIVFWTPKMYYARSIAKKLRSMLDWFSLKHADWKNYRVSSLHYFLANIFYCLGTFVKGVGPGGWSGSSKWLRLVRNWKTIDISNDLRAKPNCSLAMK